MLQEGRTQGGILASGRCEDIRGRLPHQAPGPGHRSVPASPVSTGFRPPPPLELPRHRAANVRGEIGQGAHERGHGVGAEGNQIDGVEFPRENGLPCAREVRAGDPFVGVHHQEPGHEGEPRDQGDGCEAIPPTAQDRGREPDGDEGDPHQEGRAVEARFREPVRRLVDPYALEGRRDDHPEQEKLNAPEDPEHPLVAWPFTP